MMSRFIFLRIQISTCMMETMSVTHPLPPHLEIVASLAQQCVARLNKQIEFVFTVNDSMLSGPFFYEPSGEKAVELAPEVEAFAAELEKLVAQQLSEGVLPVSYFVRVVAVTGEPVRVTEVDSSAFLVSHVPVLSADFVAGTVGVGVLDAPSDPGSGTLFSGGVRIVGDDTPVRNDALLMRKLLLERGHSVGYSVAEIDAEQQRRGMEFPPELRFYYALVREGVVAEGESGPVFAADIQAGTGAQNNVVDDAARASGKPVPEMPSPSATDSVRPLFTAREWIVFAYSEVGSQFAFDLTPGPVGRVGQVVEFAAGELVPPRVVARSLTEFLNGELVSAEVRAASWVGAGEGLSVPVEEPVAAAGVAVFARGAVPGEQLLAESDVVEVQYLDSDFDFEALTLATNLKELRFTWNGAYSVTNPEAAQNLKLQHMSAPISVWSALATAGALPQELASAQFVGAKALTSEEAEIVSTVLAHYGAGAAGEASLGLTTWHADFPQTLTEQASAAETAVTPAHSPSTSKAGSASATSKALDEPTSFVMQTAELSADTRPTPILQGLSTRVPAWGTTAEEEVTAQAKTRLQELADSYEEAADRAANTAREDSDSQHTEATVKTTGGQDASNNRPVVDQRMGDRTGDEGGFRTALKRWFG